MQDKKMTIKIITFMIILTLCLIYFNIQEAFAEKVPDTITIYEESDEALEFVPETRTYLKKTTINGKERLVFCLNGYLPAPDEEQVLNKVESLNDDYPGIAYIINKDYQQGKSSNENYYIKQTAIWWYLDDMHDQEGKHCQYVSEASEDAPCYYNLRRDFKEKNFEPQTDAYRIIGLAYNLKEEAINATNSNNIDETFFIDPQFSIKNNVKKLTTWTNDGDYFISQNISFNYTNNINEKISYQLKNAPSGTIIVNSKGEKVDSNTFNRNDTIRIKVPTNSIKELSSNFSIELSTNGTKYEAYRFKGQLETYQQVVPAALFTDTTVFNETITATINQTIVSVVKVDKDTKQRIKGITLELLDENNHKLEEWVTSDTESHKLYGLINGKTYHIREKATIDGYTLTQEITTFTPENGKEITVTFQNEKTKTSIIKVDTKTKQPVAGAKLKLTDTTTNESKPEWTWTTTTSPHVIEGLIVGHTYKVEELEAPNGYVVGPIQTITISNENKNNYVEFTNSKTIARIAKVDKDTKEFLVGAHLVLKDSTGKIVESWVSTDTPHVVEGLTINGRYTLEETKAPDGYVLSELFHFVYTNNDVIYEYENAISKISIAKFDKETNTFLQGAHLVLVDSFGEIIDEWDSTNEMHVIEKKLIIGETYILYETKAPDGYVISQPIFFVFDQNDKIVYFYNNASEIKIVKLDNDSKEFVIGAHLVLKDKDDNIIDEWDTTNEPHIINKLVVGETYTIYETKVPQGYQKLKEPVTFKVTGERNQIIAVYNSIVNPSTGDINIILSISILLIAVGITFVSYRKLKNI